MTKTILDISSSDPERFRTIGLSRIAIQKGFNFQDICYRKPHANNELLNFCKNKNLTIYHIDSHTIALSDELLISWDTICGTEMYVFGSSIENIVAFINEIHDLVAGTKKGDSNINYYYKGVHGLGVKNLDIKYGNLIIPELYPDIDIKALSTDFCNNKENILLLYGLPGTGKTTFAKYLIKESIFQAIGYTKDKQVFNHGDFWSRIISDEIDFLILDDLDFSITARTEDSEDNFMHNLLSFTDGVMENNTKVLITTNQKIRNIDAALIRPGRCFDFIILQPLANTYAKEIWINILGHDEQSFSRLFDSPLITQAALMSEHYRIINNFCERRYIKGTNNKYSLEKKIQDLGIQIQNSNNKVGFKC